MSAQPLEEGSGAPLELNPMDPDSPVGKRACAAIGELFDDIAERLHREGKPIPACIAP